MEERKGTGRRYTPEQKIKIAKEALTTDLDVCGVCGKDGVSSGLFYKWQEKFFDGALEGFRQGKDGPSSAELRRIGSQAREIDRMKSVIAEITSENIDFRKKLGEF